MKAHHLFLLLPLVLNSLVSGGEVDVSVDIRLGKVLPPPPPEVVVIAPAPQSGPPPWAPAHGHRRKYGYYYYPGADVYFRSEDRLWFYLDGGSWRFGASLPTSIRVDFHHAVPLTMATDHPFDFHGEVKGHYPADYFGTKVKVKDKEKPAVSDHGKPDDVKHEPHGEGKGNGKGKKK